MRGLTSLNIVVYVGHHALLLHHVSVLLGVIVKSTDVAALGVHVGLVVPCEANGISPTASRQHSRHSEVRLFPSGPRPVQRSSGQGTTEPESGL